MLNPTFSRAANEAVTTSYVVSETIAGKNIIENAAFDHGGEYRLQSVYGNEIWLKLERAGLGPSVLSECSVLEICAGGGFLTYHLLSRCAPKNFVVNDISGAELASARKLVSRKFSQFPVNWILGDMHSVQFSEKFDVVIGNSFMHHFYDVPKVLRRIRSLLKPGGRFISLHEPTPMSSVVEGAKILAYPLALLAPKMVNEIARARYVGEPSATDLWLFEADKLKRIAVQAGFSSARTYPWLLLRPITVQRNHLHLSKDKPVLDSGELRKLSRSIKVDAFLNRVLPQRFFGSFCIVCSK